ncbi:uncharacterized protein Dvir_GJ26428 [Drosophila virilis]|uniref:Uncharacterized protein n=1 Tax=Drosophila virilis TaxID=7244 RepID=A0A0Q9WJ36_DROVI|nr:uncharacterized protein LOC26531198 [Drosophila virilis]KRF80958.1 uncharacterized protein Dvir_GJ26428 [Drosophila virilis]
MMGSNVQSLGFGYLLRVVFLLAASIGLGKCTDRSVLQCYRCSVTVEKYFVDNATVMTPLCSKFQESSIYMVQCPYSTMCLKTISNLHLQNGQMQETVTRGCAQQKNTTQVFRNKQWEQEHLVQEVYKEGCTEIPANNLAGSKNVHCYCRGELCNSSNFLSLERKLLSMIILFNVIPFWCPTQLYNLNVFN